MSSSFGNKPRPRLAIIDVDDFQDEVDRTTSVSPTMIDLTQREEIDLTISDDDDFTVSHVRPASNIYPAVGRALISRIREQSQQVRRPPSEQRMGTSVFAWGSLSSAAQARTHYDIIDLDSDGEEVSIRFRQKAAKLDHPVDPEEEYQLFLAGLEIDDPSNWKPLQIKAEDPPHQIRNRGTTRRVLLDFPSEDFADLQKGMKAIHSNMVSGFMPHPPQLHFPAHSQGPQGPFRGLKLKCGYQFAPGGICKITQINGTVAVCSPTKGGGVDPPSKSQYNGISRPEEDPGYIDIYNCDGTIKIWHDDTGFVDLAGHSKLKPTGTKHYSINDIKFDPESRSLLSVGADCTLRVWDYDMTTEEYDINGRKLASFDDEPDELLFQPEGNAFVVSADKLHIWSGLSNDGDGFTFSVKVGNTRKAHVGAVAWGLEATKNTVFVSGDRNSPQHQAIDIVTQATYRFNVKGGADAICVNPAGNILAMAIQEDSIKKYKLHLIDVRGSPQPISSISLKRFGRDDHMREVNLTSFASDGRYLAVARSDNQTHIYDSRMLTKKPLMKCLHLGKSLVLPSDATQGENTKHKRHNHYGVLNAHWATLPSGQLQLITGGEDGCIRMWSPLRSEKDVLNGQILVQANADINFFHVGDPFAHEQPLVVGDGSGEIYIYRNLGI